MNIPLKYADLPAVLRRKPLSPVVWAITRTWLLIFAAIAACSFFPASSHWLLGGVLIGVLQYHLNVLAHDGIHYNLCANRGLNELLSRWALLAPQGLPLGAVRRSHLSHHLTLGRPEDLDRHYYDLSQHGTRGRFLRWIVGAPLGGIVLQLLRKMRHPSLEAVPESPDGPGSRLDILSVLACQALMALILWSATSRPWAYLPLWALPLITVMTGLNGIRSCLEHADLPGGPLPHRDYSFLSNPLELFLLAPFNMSHHAEHHLFTAVPFHQLPALRRLLRDRPPGIRWERSYGSRLVYLWRNFDSAFGAQARRGSAPHAQGLEQAAGQKTL